MQNENNIATDTVAEVSEVASQSQANPINNNSFSAEDYKQFQDFMQFKAMQKNTQNTVVKEKPMSTNQEVARDQELAMKKQERDQALIQLANEMQEIDSLAKKTLDKKFYKEALQNKGYSVEEILLEQKRGLVAKFVDPETIQAVARVSDIDVIDGTVLNQLVQIAKNESKKTGPYTTAINVQNGKTNRMDVPNINNDYFVPRSHDELKAACINRMKERIQEAVGDIGLKPILI